MLNGLRKNLYERIKDKFPYYLTRSEVEAICKELNHYPETATRKLRLLCQSGKVENIKSAKGAIIGWKLTGGLNKLPVIKIINAPLSTAKLNPCEGEAANRPLPGINPLSAHQRALSLLIRI